jgi:hypothetical protein
VLVAEVTLDGRVLYHKLLFDLELFHTNEVSEIAERKSAKNVIILAALIFLYHRTLKLRDLFGIFRGLV